MYISFGDWTDKREDLQLAPKRTVIGGRSLEQVRLCRKSLPEARPLEMMTHLKNIDILDQAKYGDAPTLAEIHCGESGIGSDLAAGLKCGF